MGKGAVKLRKRKNFLTNQSEHLHIGVDAHTFFDSGN